MAIDMRIPTDAKMEELLTPWYGEEMKSLPQVVNISESKKGINLSYTIAWALAHGWHLLATGRDESGQWATLAKGIEGGLACAYDPSKDKAVALGLHAKPPGDNKFSYFYDPAFSVEKALGRLNDWLPMVSIVLNKKIEACALSDGSIGLWWWEDDSHDMRRTIKPGNTISLVKGESNLVVWVKKGTPQPTPQGEDSIAVPHCTRYTIGFNRSPATICTSLSGWLKDRNKLGDGIKNGSSWGVYQSNALGLDFIAIVVVFYDDYGMVYGNPMVLIPGDCLEIDRDGRVSWVKEQGWPPPVVPLTEERKRVEVL